MNAGGQMTDVYETDRGTIKQSCTNTNENDMPTNELCDYIVAQYGMEMCDTECQPFGGVFDYTTFMCDWSDTEGPLSKCPEELRRISSFTQELECDVSCAFSGYRAWSEEY